MAILIRGKFNTKANIVAPLNKTEKGINIESANATEPFNGFEYIQLEYVAITFISMPISIWQQR